MYRIRARLKQSEGFTIIELMMATMVFSVIMLIAAGTVVRFTNNFQKGVTQSTTQGVARGLVDNISQQLQFVGSMSGFRKLAAPEGTSYKGYCIHGTRYSFVLGKQLEREVQNVLVEDSGMGEGCGGVARNLSSGVSGNELLAPNMRLAKFEVINDADPGDEADGSSNPRLYKVKVKVVYGDDDLLCVDGAPVGSEKDCSNTKASMSNVSALNQNELNRLSCKTQIGSQFCAVSEISTTVQNRL